MNTLASWGKNILLDADIRLDGTRPGDVVVHDDRIFRKAFLFGTLGLGDGYMAGDWDCERLDVFFDKVLRAKAYTKLGRLVESAQFLRDAAINLQSVSRAFQVGERHYDLGNALYEKMLGHSMGYSAGYYRNGATTNDEAQYAKFDIICKKLGLTPGMRVLEIGCGWGTFAEHAIKHYGVEVVGVSVSKEQTAYARTRCEGLAFTCVVADYRELPEEFVGSFDRVVSIEMVEAVGPKNFRTYMETARRALKPGGAFLMQAIMGAGTHDPWIARHIFPNGVLPSMQQIATSIRGLFEIDALESFGTDYDRTLMSWNERFEASWPEISAFADDSGKRLYDETFRRMWRYYLLCCAGTFRSRQIDVSQFLFRLSP
jgi:cyclopropane-fatty-acyl-phospholipid synthase